MSTLLFGRDDYSLLATVLQDLGKIFVSDMVTE